MRLSLPYVMLSIQGDVVARTCASYAAVAFRVPPKNHPSPGYDLWDTAACRKLEISLASPVNALDDA